MKNNIRITMTIIITFLLLCLVGCTKNSPSNNTTKSEQITTNVQTTMKDVTMITTKENETSSTSGVSTTQVTTEIKINKDVFVSFNMSEYKASIDSEDFEVSVKNDSQYNYIYITIKNLKESFTGEYRFYVNDKEVEINSINEDKNEVVLRIVDNNWTEIV